MTQENARAALWLSRAYFTDSLRHGDLAAAQLHLRNVISLQRAIRPDAPLPSIADALKDLRRSAAEYGAAVKRFEEIMKKGEWMNSFASLCGPQSNGVKPII